MREVITCKKCKNQTFTIYPDNRTIECSICGLKIGLLWVTRAEEEAPLNAL